MIEKVHVHYGENKVYVCKGRDETVKCFEIDLSGEKPIVKELSIEESRKLLEELRRREEHLEKWFREEVERFRREVDRIFESIKHELDRVKELFKF